MPGKSKRLRIIAGPNGSGKSTFIDTLRKNFDCGIYINTDEIEKGLRDTGFINLNNYKISSTPEDFNSFILSSNSQSLIQKATKEGLSINLTLEENILISNSEINSYEAALIVEYIKNKLIENMQLFTFETVMSHHSKLDFVKDAIARGYRVYLYFIATESVDINIGRVAQRVMKRGHNVSEAKIRERYIKTLELLSATVSLTYRTFLFDNSTEESPLLLVGEIFKGEELTIHSNYTPQWIYKYVLEPLGFV